MQAGATQSQDFNADIHLSQSRQLNEAKHAVYYRIMMAKKIKFKEAVDNSNYCR